VSNPNFFGRRSSIASVAPTCKALHINIARLKPGVGDILMLTPALLGLREKFPNAEITLTVCDNYNFDTRPGSKHGAIYNAVKYLPYVDKVITDKHPDAKNPIASYYIDISSAAGEIREESPGKKSLERIDIFSRYLGVTPSNKRPFLHVPKEEKEAMFQRLQKAGYTTNKKLVVIAENSNTWLRDLPKNILQDYCKLCADNKELFPVLFSDLFLEPWNISGLTEFRGTTNEEFLALIALADIVMTPDTGTLHVAGALNRRIVAYWGPTHPDSRTSYYKNVTNLWHKEVCPKSPCWYSQQNCSNRVCFKAITSVELYNSTIQRLEAPYEELEEWRAGVSIVVPILLSNQDVIIQSLKSLYTSFKNSDVEIILVSRKERYEEVVDLSRRFCPVADITATDASNYEGMFNSGVESATKDLVLFIHDDIDLNQKSFNRLLTVYNNTPDTGIVGGLLKMPNGTVERSGLVNNKDNLMGMSFNTAKQISNPIFVDSISDACFLIDRIEFISLGKFVTNTIDFCSKYKQLTKKEIVVATNSSIVHRNLE